MNTISKTLRKSNLNIKDDFDIYQLERKSDYLLDCTVTKNLDEYNFQFMYENEKFYHEIKTMSLSLKYRALINIKNLKKDSGRIKFSLDPENLMYDVNMMPKVIMRDIYEDETFEKGNFLIQYKSLIGFVLQNKYEYSDYFDGGLKLLSKNKMTAQFENAESIEELVDLLNESYEKLQMTLQTSLIEVDKKKYKKLKTSNKLFMILLLITMASGIYFGYFKLIESKAFNTANEAFINQDYISVMETLKDMKIDKMNMNTKYILAVSNVKTESLTNEQKNNILSSISINSDTRILEFWICLGKNDMDEAIDIAKQLGNKEYIAYGYMKQKSHVENDTSISGSQREQKLKEIESGLKELNISTETEQETPDK